MSSSAHRGVAQLLHVAKRVVKGSDTYGRGGDSSKCKPHQKDEKDVCGYWQTAGRIIRKQQVVGSSPAIGSKASESGFTALLSLSKSADFGSFVRRSVRRTSVYPSSRDC